MREQREGSLSSKGVEVYTLPVRAGTKETLTHEDKRWIVSRFNRFLESVPESREYYTQLSFVPFSFRRGAGTRADERVIAVSVPSYDMTKEEALLQAKVNFLHAYSHSPTKTAAGSAMSRPSEEASTYIRGRSLARELGIGVEFEEQGAWYMLDRLACEYSGGDDFPDKESPEYQAALRVYRERGIEGIRDELLKIEEGKKVEWWPTIRQGKQEGKSLSDEIARTPAKGSAPLRWGEVPVVAHERGTPSGGVTQVRKHRRHVLQRSD